MDFNLVHLLIKWAALALAFFVAAKALKGMTIKGGVGSYLVISAVYAVLMVVLGFCLKFAFHTLTLGTFLLFGIAVIIDLVVMTIVIVATDKLSKRLSIDKMSTAFFAALIIALVNFAVKFALTKMG